MKLKFTLTLMVVLVAGILSFSASAYSFRVNGLCYDINSDGTSVTVTYEQHGSSDNTNPRYSDIEVVVVPSTVTYNNKTYKVTAIGDYAFRYCKQITSIEIPKTVKSIGVEAFRSNSGVKTVHIANGSELESIGQQAFRQMTGLEYMNIEVTTKLKQIGPAAFWWCSSLPGTFDLSNNTSLTTIPEQMLSQCKKLKSIKLPESITSIGQLAFSQCNALEEFVIPPKVTELPNSVFYACNYLRSINIHDNIKRIGPYAFSGIGLTYGDLSVTIPSSVESIDRCAFKDAGVQSINIPSSVKYIGEEVFYRCKNLTNVDIQNTTIGKGQFKETTALKTVDLSHVDSIKSEAFYESGITSLTIPSNVKYVESSLCKKCLSLTTVNIQNDKIAAQQFSGCTALSDVAIGKNVINIESNAFLNCTALKELAIPSNVAAIDGTAFSGCNAIETLKIDNQNFANISYFPDCKTVVKTVILGKAVVDLPANAFNGCTALLTAILPSTMFTMGNSSFEGCRALMNLTALMPRPISIDASVFEGVQKQAYCDLHVPKGSGERYRMADVWKEFGYILEDAVEPGDDPVTDTGDVNGDGKVDVEDVNAIINIILQTAQASQYTGEADVNGDGKVDVEDVNAIINIILNV